MHSIILNTNRRPRGLVGAVRAQKPLADTITEITQGFNDFKANYDGKLNSLETWVSTQFAAKHLNGGGGNAPFAGMPVEPEYTEAFAKFFRSGGEEESIKAANAIGQRAEVRAALSVGDNSNGGYLAPVEWDRKIIAAQTASSPMRRLATVQSTSVGAYTTLWNDEIWGSGWVGETASRPQTVNATLAQVTFAHGEIYANIAATQRILDDSAINVEQWLAEQVEGEFSKQEDLAFITGNGTNKPYGLLQYVTGGTAASVHPGGVLTTVTVAGAAAITFDELIDFTYGLAAPYRQNASWLMNSQTAAKLAKIKDADGNYIWREGVAVGTPPTLLGRPVAFDENMPAATAGNLPIAFGDFKSGYLINDRFGTRVLRDPYTNKPYVMFYCTKRVGGGVLDPKAIRLIKMAAS